MMLLLSFGVGVSPLHIVVLLLNLSSVVGHGYLKSPRSRNYVAYKSAWWPLDDTAPWPESDTQSLNTGGAIARCGKVSDRNYDRPKNNEGKPLANQVQATYEERSLIDLYVVLSAVHGGHFVYKACPISPGEVATQACFDSHPLEFVKDNFYDAVQDSNYPERAYLPPNSPGGPELVEDPADVPGKAYSHQYRLPAGLIGSHVLIQWHYVTSNSGCSHEGYGSYPWPHGWDDQYLSKPCPPLSTSGGSFAEQFWNCAEVEIFASTSPSTTTATSTTPATTTYSTSSSATTVSTTTTKGASLTTTATSRKRAGDSCSLPQECVSGSCFDSQCECRRDSDCIVNEICNIGGNGAEEYVFRCMEISRSAGESCQLPSQCNSGSCYKSICECRADSDCVLGKVCERSRDRFVCTERASPTKYPTKHPTILPTISFQPSSSLRPSITSQPSSQPLSPPSHQPSFQPSVSSQPSSQPSLQPSQKSSPDPHLRPSITSQPSSQHSSPPSPQPSLRPSISSLPSREPSRSPSSQPSVSSTSQPPGQPSHRGPYRATVAAYYASWQWYDRNKLAAPSNIDFSKVDRVNFAFFQSDQNGYLFGTDPWADSNLLLGPRNWNPGPDEQTYCSWDNPNPKTKTCNHHNYDAGLISLVHAAGAEIYPSIGGWTLSDAFVATMAASSTARATFANQCKELIQDYGFDGIDIDWEYPGFTDHSGTVHDKSNFNFLLTEVRAALDDLESQTGKRYGLTAALPCGPQHMVNMDIPQVSSILDELNVMSYDFGGSWSATTSANAPMVYQGWGTEDFSVSDCVRNWVDGGGSREKINLGISFYGRSFAGATDMNQEHQGADKAKWHADEGTPQYYNILAQLPNMVSVRDDHTKMQYAYFPPNEGGGLVSFDNERSICDKTEYAIENNLNGFLIWELSGDLLQDLSTPLLDSINRKLADP